MEAEPFEIIMLNFFALIYCKTPMWLISNHHCKLLQSNTDEEINSHLQDSFVNVFHDCRSPICNRSVMSVFFFF